MVEYTVSIPVEAVPAINKFVARQPEKYPNGAGDFAQVVVNEVVARIFDDYDPPEVVVLKEQIAAAQAVKATCMAKVAVARAEPVKEVIVGK